MIANYVSLRTLQGQMEASMWLEVGNEVDGGTKAGFSPFECVYRVNQNRSQVK